MASAVAGAVALVFAACGSSSSSSQSITPAPAGGEQPTATEADPPAAQDSGGDPLTTAFEAATKWNMNQIGQVELSEQEVEALAETTRSNLGKACEQNNECACNALKSGECGCPDEPSCIGEPFWFVSGQ